MTDILIYEAQFIDPRANSDKFYRVFAFGSFWTSQYGRNGTAGTFTAVMDAGSPEGAIAAAEKKFAEKIKKGYELSRTVSSRTSHLGGAIDTMLLDRIARTPHLDSADPPPQPRATALPGVEAVAIPARRDDLTPLVVTALTRFGGERPAEPEDLNPALPLRPMLASETHQDQLERMLNGYLDDDRGLVDDEWIAQHKYDGDRAVIEIVDGDLRVRNRRGEEKVRGVTQEMLEPFTALHSGRWVFDGEIVGRTLVVFDLVVATDGNATWVHHGHPFVTRYRALVAILMLLDVPMVALAPEDSPAVLAPIATTAGDKNAMLQDAIDRNREGLVLRHRTGRYEQGRRSTALLKYKLLKDADVVIAAQHPSRQSVSLAVYLPDGSTVEVGQASIIGKGDVTVGETWVVRYLYIVEPDHPRLVQPRLVRKRDDKIPAECTIEQFANAGTSRIV